MMNATRRNRPPPEPRTSSLLTKDENELVFGLLGKKCVSLATTVVQVYMTEPPRHQQWKKHYCGVICLVKDNPRRSYFIRLIDMDKQEVVWDQELYDQFEYKTPKTFFHTFEADNCLTGLNFADENEAKFFRQTVTTKLRQWQQKQERKHAHQSLQPSQRSVSASLTGRRAESLPSLSNNSNIEKKKKLKKRPKITKKDIGLPKNFIHIQHVGWDNDFDISQSEELDPQLREFFKCAGVSEKHLADKQTRNFIYDFISKNGVMNAIKEGKPTGQPPPVPARDVSAAHHQPSPLSTRAAAPALPMRNSAPPPPVPPVPPNRGPAIPPPLPPSNKPTSLLISNTIQPPLPPTSMRVPPPLPPTPPVSSTPASAPPPPAPPPPPPVAPPPPPPPPPPPIDTCSSVQNNVNNSKSSFPVSDARSALLEGIRKGVTLNHVDVNEESVKVSPNDRSALLDEIRQGIELRPVSEDVRNAPSSAPLEGLAGALAHALQERARALQETDDSDSETDDDDDEWED